MKMEALTTFMKDQTDVKKVYLINQNYAHGHQVAKYAKENLARKRPDVQIVGEDLHPLAQARDFAPYIAKIKASGADTVITGNWGSDLTLLVKAANDGGLNAKFYTYYAGGQRHAHGAWAPTPPAASTRSASCPTRHTGGQRKLMDEFKAKFNDDFYTGADLQRLRRCCRQAMAKAKSTDPVKVAAALEGLKVKSFNGEVEMRKTDHQLQQTAVHRGVAEGRTPSRTTTASRTPATTSGTGQDLRAYVVEHADVVPDEAPRRALTPRRSIDRGPARSCSRRAPFVRPGATCDAECDQFLINLPAQRPQLRAAAVHAQLGPDADLQHDGRAELRARQLLHGGRLLRLLAVTGWSASGRRWCWRRWLVGVLGALFERYCAAPGAQVRPRARAADHLRPVLS